MTTETIAAMDDTTLNHHLALAQGFTYVGPMRGVAFYHPPGERNRVVPLPDYVHDWNLLMPLVFQQDLLETLVGLLRDATDGGQAGQRQIGAALLWVLTKKERS
jgi:hypothetical protein